MLTLGIKRDAPYVSAMVESLDSGPLDEEKDEKSIKRKEHEEEVKDEWLGHVHDKNAWKSEEMERENTEVFHVFWHRFEIEKAWKNQSRPHMGTGHQRRAYFSRLRFHPKAKKCNLTKAANLQSK